MSDIVRNHHDKLPADWHEPVPVPFLAVKSATFLISIVARNPKNKDIVIN
jgi:CRISPR-associated protein Cmr6